jgi:hypothetical protein
MILLFSLWLKHSTLVVSYEGVTRDRKITLWVPAWGGEKKTLEKQWSKVKTAARKFLVISKLFSYVKLGQLDNFVC